MDTVFQLSTCLTDSRFWISPRRQVTGRVTRLVSGVASRAGRGSFIGTLTDQLSWTNLLISLASVFFSAKGRSGPVWAHSFLKCWVLSKGFWNLIQDFIRRQLGFYRAPGFTHRLTPDSVLGLHWSLSFWYLYTFSAFKKILFGGNETISALG